MKKLLLFTILLTYGLSSFSQETKGSKEKEIEAPRVIPPSIHELNSLIELEKVKSENSHLKQEIKRLETEISKNLTSSNQDLKDLKEDTKDRINIYVFFIGLILALIGTAINFFGDFLKNSGIDLLDFMFSFCITTLSKK